ncbi:hypothetical protein TYRP_001569 [Tyrophagus putrescentiae]|nr:hypothetical protein TYRP_001569 [Tyrophagus putrescentiae]
MFCLCLWQSRRSAPSVVVELLCSADAVEALHPVDGSQGALHRRGQSKNCPNRGQSFPQSKESCTVTLTVVSRNTRAGGGEERHYHSTAGPAEEVGKMRRFPRSQLNSLLRSFFSDPSLVCEQV